MTATKHENPVISSDFIKTGTQFSAVADTLYHTQSLSHCINWALELVDRRQYLAMKELRNWAKKNFAYLKALAAIDPLLMEGQAIMYNRKTQIHLDCLDPFKSWATMVVLGTFDNGGTLIIHRLNLRIRYLPGDAIFIRGRLLEHEVEAWSKGQRISIAHFTHTALWNQFDMQCP